MYPSITSVFAWNLVAFLHGFLDIANTLRVYLIVGDAGVLSVHLQTDMQFLDLFT